MNRTPSKIRIVCLTLIILYVPYCWLVFYTGWDWQLIRLWPLFRGLAVSTAIHLFLPNSPLLQGPDGALVFTVLLLGLSILGVLRFQEMFWWIFAGLFVLSSALTSVIFALLKA